MPKDADPQAEAKKRLADAQAALEEARQEAADAGAGLAAVTTRGIPEMIVEVAPGNTVSHDGETYYGEGYPFAPEGHKGNDELSLDGPTAIALMQGGHVRVKGAA
jgi:hypothetical protein